MDYDGDGDLDLVTGSDNCCDVDHLFYLFRRDADGRFQACESIRTTQIPAETRLLMRTRVYVADWNGDGRLDLIGNGGADPDRRFISVLLAPGPLADRDTIELTQRIDSSEPLRIIWTRPNVADWDGDGLPDLLVGIKLGHRKGDVQWTVFLFRSVNGPKGARFGDPERLLTTPDGDTPAGLDVADWDGDGNLDLIVGLIRWEAGDTRRRNPRSQVWVYRRQAPE